ncbi:hypothetical protein EDD85DRAFT_799003 [Armillaria nabsnona]|nr:hypothetical protein EDD85DRAFT_799003 [Armillaria nabsnona]
MRQWLLVNIFFLLMEVQPSAFVISSRERKLVINLHQSNLIETFAYGCSVLYSGGQRDPTGSIIEASSWPTLTSIGRKCLLSSAAWIGFSPNIGSVWIPSEPLRLVVFWARIVKAR